MRNWTTASLVAALFSAGFLLAAPAQSATVGGTSNGMERDGLVQTIGYGSHDRYGSKRFHRRHHYDDRYRHAFRHGYRVYRPYHARDYYIYHRPGVRFGLDVRTHRHHRHHDRYHY